MNASAKSCGWAKTARAALDAGYERATLTILDANVTNPDRSSGAVSIRQADRVKGFAVTLSLGVISEPVHRPDSVENDFRVPADQTFCQNTEHFDNQSQWRVIRYPHALACVN